VPLFVAVDAVGVLPLFLSLTEGMEAARLRVVIVQSVITAAAVALIFVAFGPVLLRFLGITVSDFMIAGGILLLAFSLRDLLSNEKVMRQVDAESLGAVPLGVPLITGPAVLTTSILLAGIHGILLTSAALVANIGIAGLTFVFSRPITLALGKTGAKTVSKVASLLLAAIAVMLIRKGVAGVLAMPV
jgi:multiple antibiotic resistance protein